MPYGMQQPSQDEGQLHHALVLYVVDPILFREMENMCLWFAICQYITIWELYVLPVFG